jgi:hypothetical protein
MIIARSTEVYLLQTWNAQAPRKRATQCDDGRDGERRCEVSSPIHQKTSKSGACHSGHVGDAILQSNPSSCCVRAGQCLRKGKRAGIGGAAPNCASDKASEISVLSGESAAHK